MALWSIGRWLSWNLCVRAIVYLTFFLSRIEKWNKERKRGRLWLFFCEFEKYWHFSDKYDDRLMLFLLWVFFFFRVIFLHLELAEENGICNGLMVNNQMGIQASWKKKIVLSGKMVPKVLLNRFLQYQPALTGPI